MFLQLFEDDESPDIDLAPGEVLFNEGDTGESAYVVHSGQVMLKAGGKEFGSMSVSDIFGEMALIDDHTRSATAIAGPDGAKLYSLDKPLFLEMVKADPEFAVELMKVMVDRLRRAGER